MEPIDPELKAILDQLGLEPTEEFLQHLARESKSRFEAHNWVAAKTYAEVALPLSVYLYGEDDPLTLDLMNNMGLLHLRLGGFVEAETFLRRALDGRRRALRAHHPKTLINANHLAMALTAQGRLMDAEQFCQGAVAGLRTELGDDDPETITAIQTRGLLFHRLGRLSEADEDFSESLESYIRVLGAGHHYTLTAKNNLGLLRKDQGRLSEAKKYIEQALDGSRRELGDEHPDTLAAYSNLGWLLFDLGRKSDAVSRLERALVGRVDALGWGHPETVTSCNDMGCLLLDLGMLAEAREYIELALDGRWQTVGQEHEETFATMGNLGALLKAEGKLAEAEECKRVKLDGFRRVLGQQNPRTLRASTSLARILYERFDILGAEAELSRSFPAIVSMRGSVSGTVERAMFSEALGLAGSSLMLASFRARLCHAVSSVFGVLEAGSSRSILDLLQGRGTNMRSAAIEMMESGRWSKSERDQYLFDLDRARELEVQEKLLAGQGVPFESDDRTTIDREYSAVRDRLFQAEKELLPAARTKSLDDIRAVLRPGETLLSYGWCAVGISLASVPHSDLGESSAHWLSRVDAWMPGAVVAECERDLIAALQCVAFVIAAGFSPDAAISDAVARAIPYIEAGCEDEGEFRDPESDDKRAVFELDESVLSEIRDFASRLETAKQLHESSGVRVPVASMPLDALGALSRLLLDFIFPAEIRPMLSKAERVVVVPSGPLHELPLDVLVELAGFEELVNKPVTVVPSGSILAILRSRGGETHPNGVTAVGDPEADIPGGSDQDRGSVSELEVLLGDRAGGTGRLPRAGTEARLVASYFGDEPILGGDATPQRVHAEAPGRRVVHLSAHAVLGAMGEPMASAVLLTGERDENGDVRGGRLTLADLIATWGDRLSGCEMAVLSCCQTGRGVTVGDSVMALPIGLLHAGVNRVVASLWKVQDLATCLLMMRFYQNYLGVHRNERGEADLEPRSIWGRSFADGQAMSTPEALAEAKRWLRELSVERLSIIKEKVLGRLEDEKAEHAEAVFLQKAYENPDRPPFAEPRYWAAFTIIGDA